MIEIEKSRLGLQKVERIHHVSDIHIRNYKRHAEYNRVFQNLYSEIRKNSDKNDLILLTGDIVHSKTDVTPELFNEVQKFLTSLCEIAPVLMIPGNHDANLNNSHRLDALSPIVNAMNNPRLEYVKESAIIRMGNVDFYHWSVFDEIKNYPVPFEDSQTKIALFHGPVNHCVTEAGYLIENEKITVDSFRGFDMVMLGDIHKLQFLNPQKTIAYPGSLIQQNHGEDRQHGYLLWEVESKFVEFVKIDNDTAFYTLDVDSALHKELDETLPQNVFLRVRYKNTDQASLRNIVEDVRKQRNLVEVTTQRISTATAREKSTHSSRGLDFRSIEQQDQLIKKFLKEKHNIKDEDLLTVLEINEHVNKSLKKNEVPRNSMWIPKRFEFENMFSYGKDNYVDFTDMKGVYGLFAPNASGKSTLLDSLTYCLFDKCTKTNRGHQVMNSNSDKFYCKLNFELNGLDYYIERSARKQSSGNVRVEVDFYYVNDGGDKVSLNGKDRADTNANIRNLLGTYEDFVLTTLSTQSNNTGFIDMNQKDRKDLLSQFMDIGVFEELYNIANEEGRETSAVLKHYQKTDYEAKLSLAQSELETKNKELEESLSNKKSVESKLSETRTELEQQTSKLIPVDNSVIDETAIKNKLSSSKSSLDQLNKEKQDIKSQLHGNAIELDEINFILDQTDEKELNKKVQACKLLNDDLQQLNQQIYKLGDHIAHKADKMGKLKELEYDPDCKYCMGNVFVKDAISAKEQIEADKKNLQQLESQKKELVKQINDCTDVYQSKDSHDENKKRLAELNNTSSILSLKLEKTENRIQLEENAIKDCQDKLELRKKQLTSIKSNEAVNERIDEIKKRLKQLETDLKSANATISDLNAEVKISQKTVENLKTEIEKRAELERKHIYYQYYLEAVHRDGIPHDVISVTIPHIEEEVNNILSQLVDFKIIFETDEKNVNAYIAYSEEKFWPLELTSGMEKFVSSLAIRTSLINVSSLPRPNFVAIDEGFGTLDKGNLGSMSMLFEYLKTQFRFLVVISHIDSMRDIVDDYIDVHKIDSKSSVKHG